MSHPILSTVRADDLLRHLQDLRSGTYEGARSRGAKEVVYRQGVELLRPVAVEILEEANTLFFNGTANVQMIGPEDDGSGGLVTRFELSWPQQRAARVTRGPNGPLQPVRIVVNYSQGFHHPHLSGSTAGFWPFQVTSAADAGRQKGVLAAIVELELHQRIFETDWRILPVSRQWEISNGLLSYLPAQQRSQYVTRLALFRLVSIEVSTGQRSRCMHSGEASKTIKPCAKTQPLFRFFRRR